MRKGFTILELLVASLLLGMMMMVLTMIFNQSSVAWRTGNADQTKLEDVRTAISEVRVASDDAYIWDNKGLAVTGVWDGKGEMRKRAVDLDGDVGSGAGTRNVRSVLIGCPFTDVIQPHELTTINVGDAGNSGKVTTYTINVKSCGPDRKLDTYDDIWSYPDDFD